MARSFRLVVAMLLMGTTFLGCQGGGGGGCSREKAKTKLPPSDPVAISTTALPNGWIPVPYNASIAAIAGLPPLTWSLEGGTFPPGLALDPATGHITGTPTAWGRFEFSVSVRDSASPTTSDVRPYSILITTNTWEDVGHSSWGVPHTTRVTGFGSATVGGISGTPSPSSYPAITLSGGTPVVAWTEYAGLNPEIHLRRQDPAGGVWKELGGSASGGGVSATPGISQNVAVAADASGGLYVAWQESEDTTVFFIKNDEIHLKYWTGSMWVGLAGSASPGGISGTSDDSQHPAIAVDAAGFPWVAWTETAGSGSVRAKKWDGAAWVEIGSSATGDGISGPGVSSPVNLGVDDHGYPVMAWADSGSIRVRHWDGSGWTGFGATDVLFAGSLTLPAAGWPSIAIDSSGYPVVSYTAAEPGADSWEIRLERWDGGKWAGVGGSDAGGGVSGTGTSSDRSKVALDGADHPVVLWYETLDFRDELYMKAWDGAAWTELAGSGSGSGLSGTSTEKWGAGFVVGSDGHPRVTWGDGKRGGGYAPHGNSEIFFRSFDGSAWIEEPASINSAALGGVSASPANTSHHVVAVDEDGDPTVAWSEEGKGLFVRQWTGSAWVELGGSASHGGINGDNPAYRSVNTIGLALDPEGRPVVGWCSYDTDRNNAEVYLKRWDGAAWIGLAGSGLGFGVSASDRHSFVMDLALDAAGNPMVVWQDIDQGFQSPGRDIFVKVWNGTAWVGLGGSDTGEGITPGEAEVADMPDIAVDPSGHPVVAYRGGPWTTGRIMVKQWTGTGWASLEGATPGEGAFALQGYQLGLWPSVAVDGAGHPVVSAIVSDNFPDGTRSLWLLQWDGTRWVELAGSGSGSGIATGPYTTSLRADLALTAAGLPMVVWDNAHSGNSEIYFRYWDGTQWSEHHHASASAGGISNAEGTSYAPRIATGGGMVAVVWEDDGAASQDVYLRRTAAP